MSLWFARARAASVLALALAVALGLAATASAQGVQTSTLSGSVNSTDGAVLPGVTVSLTSPSLQGARSTTTDANGSYIFRGLPGGTYKVTFTLSGFGTVERDVEITLGTPRPLDATLSVASVTESVTVTAVAPSVLENTSVGATYKAEKIDKLATGRTIQNIAELSPGLNDNTPNANQLSISGAFAYDNVFLLNGVDVNDNLFGTANNLFIEDALDEIQVLTSGISAEYGRFSGGVVNAVTKRGGNKFSGSLRADLTNPKWQDESKFEQERIDAGVAGAAPHIDKMNKIWQFTLGGPIIKDKLWFFAAHRRENSSDPKILSNTGISYNLEVENPRYEAKLTGSPTANHTFTASYIRNTTDQRNRASINETASIDPATLVSRTLPNDLFVANYNGVLSANLFVEAQFSQKTQGFRGTGGTSTDIHDSPFMSLGLTGLPAGRHFNAPYFDSNDPEDRNNRQYTAALSYFLSTGSMGRHDIKVGGEHFTSWRTGGNSQSSTGYVFFGDPVMSGGTPVIDSSGRLIPTFVPGQNRITNWIPVRGAQIDLHTLSFYANDRWTLNEHVNFNLGVRYERHTADTTQAGIVTPSSNVVVPRLGISFDPKGDGQFVLQASYAVYAGKASETQFADNTNVGTPNNVQLRYNGPAGQGLGFAPGFDLNNYTVFNGSFPLANVALDTGLETPSTREYTFQAGSRLGQRGEIKAIYTNRRTSNLLDDFITLDNGRTTVTEGGRTFGTFDNALITNTDIPFRNYDALQFQTSYRMSDNWSMWAHYTHQIKNEGNFEGEGANTPGIYSVIGDYPELRNEARHFPAGRLNQYQAHKVRAAMNYDLGMGGAGTLNLGVLYRYDSPQAFNILSNNVPITAQQRALAAGYAALPAVQTIYYEGRGTGEFEAQSLVDLSLNYDIPVYKSVRPYVKAELRNAFNGQPKIGFDTTVTPNNNGPRDALGIPTEFVRGPNFGTEQVLTHNPVPREFRLALGFRF
jgi:carboxypeptidase family protein/TonB-dependent receptor-like protein